MKFNSKIIVLAGSMLIAAPAFAAKKNLCDELIESGKSSQDTIERCFARFGQSDHYKSQEKNIKAKAEADKMQREAELAIKSNIETKTFSELDLEDASFGKSFFALQIDYTNPQKPKETKITEGDILCKYLGYEKAIKSKLSPEIMPIKAHGNGLFISKTFFGNAKEEPELYEDKKANSTVRKYMEIKCGRLSGKDMTGSKEYLKKIVEEVDQMNKWFDEPAKDDKSAVDQSSRKSKKETDGSTPHGFKKTDFLAPTGTSK